MWHQVSETFDKSLTLKFDLNKSSNKNSNLIHRTVSIMTFIPVEQQDI